MSFGLRLLKPHPAEVKGKMTHPPPTKQPPELPACIF